LIRKTLGRYRNRRLFGALVVASTVTAASTVAVVGVPGASAATSSSTPTASINVWMVDNGKNIDNLWAQLASQFDAAHPGDHVNVSITPSSGNTYQVKLLSALGTSNPPALFFSWGGGALQQYIQAGKAQPIGDAGMTDAGKPTWTKDFLPSSLGPVTFNGKLYGIPILGTQPVLFFYNKTVLAKYHLGFPQTLPQLLSDVKTLASHNTTLIGLGNLDNWEGLMYLEYFADRAGGPKVFLNIQANQKGAWSNPAIISALTDIQTLVKDKAFETGYDSISWGNGFIDALVYQGVAAMELMGDWDLGILLSDNPSFVNSGQLGLGEFPSVPGGKGNPTDLEGNTTNYAALASHLSPAQTYVAEQFAAWAFSSHAYAAAEVKNGLVPLIAGSAGLLNSSPLKRYLVPVYNDVAKAPYFQYSWDQALGPVKATPMVTNLGKVFDLTETPAQFAKIMNAYQTGS
jgi:ABC-type glycerol-3-phosphate transport system substrate-binding protein